MASATPASDAFEGIMRGDYEPLVRFVVNVLGPEECARMLAEMSALPVAKRFQFMCDWIRKRQEALEDEQLSGLMARM